MATKETKKKVPIMSTAMAAMGAGTTLLGKGQYIEGGILILTGFACIAAYEVYQVRELPEPVTDDMIKTGADMVADEIKDLYGSQSHKSDTQSTDEDTSKDVTIDTDHSSDVSESPSMAQDQEESVADEDMDISAAEIGRKE